MENLTRREFHAGVLGSLVTYSLLETLSNERLFADEIRPVATKWLKSVNELAGDVKEQRVTQVAWQKQVEQLFSQIELSDLLALVDFEQLTKEVKYPEKGHVACDSAFQKLKGSRPSMSLENKSLHSATGDRLCLTAITIWRQAFLMLKGKLHGRHYDRIEDQKDALIIRPTIDRSFSAGETSSVSDYKDNIHWFEAESEAAFIFNIHVLNVRPGSAQPTGRVYLNPDGEKLADGLIRAPRLSYKESQRALRLALRSALYLDRVV